MGVTERIVIIARPSREIPILRSTFTIGMHGFLTGLFHLTAEIEFTSVARRLDYLFGPENAGNVVLFDWSVDSHSFGPKLPGVP